jgi:hypothetical protein
MKPPSVRPDDDCLGGVRGAGCRRPVHGDLGSPAGCRVAQDVTPEELARR